MVFLYVYKISHCKGPLLHNHGLYILVHKSASGRDSISRIRGKLLRSKIS